MHWFRISLPPYTGEYPLDTDEQPLTTREWGWIKRFSGYLPGQAIDEDGMDAELTNAFAVIALRRAGKVETADVPHVYERMLDVPFEGDMVRDDDDQEEEPVDPPTPPKSGSSSATNGDGSKAESETSPPTPPASGGPGSATSTSAPKTWVS